MWITVEKQLLAMTESDHTGLLNDEDLGQKTAMFNIIYDVLNIHTN